MAEVLISGASVAGLSAAHWFVRTGHRVTVVEQAAGLRRGGAPIDVRGEALAVAERMGILDEIRANRVPRADALPVLDGEGLQVATLDLSWFANETADDIEISRDRLADILRAAVDPSVDLRFSTSIARLADGPSGIDATMADGTTATFDLVVGADGLHSNVRSIAFGPESDYVSHIGYYVALLNLPDGVQWDRALLNVPGLAVAVRDTGDGPRVMVLARGSGLAFDPRDHHQSRQLAAAFLEPVDAWQVPAIRRCFLDPETAGLYFDSVSQVHMPSWTSGRVALIGDAAHCSALLSGMGTSLAMLGAETLAMAYAAADGDLGRASVAYHDHLRPVVDRAQTLVDVGGAVVVPGTSEELEQRNQMFRDVADRHRVT